MLSPLGGGSSGARGGGTKAERVTTEQLFTFRKYNEKKENMDMDEIVESGKAAAVRQLFKQWVLAMARTDDVCHCKYVQKARQVQERLNRLSDTKDIVKTRHLFVTVNPRPEVSVSDFVTKCHKLVQKQWIEAYEFVVEQRGDTDDEVGRGMHAHFIVRKPLTKGFAQCRRECASTMSSVCDTENYCIFNVKGLKADSDVSKARDYIRGLKDVSGDKSYKAQRVLNDKKFRQEHGLSPLYNAGELLLLVSSEKQDHEDDPT